LIDVLIDLMLERAIIGGASPSTVVMVVDGV